MDGFLLGVVAGFMLGTLCCLVLMVFAFDSTARRPGSNPPPPAGKAPPPPPNPPHVRRRWPRVL